MQIKIKKCRNIREFQIAIRNFTDSSKQLIKIITSKSEAVNKKIIESCRLLFPLSKLVGVTAERGIINSKTAENAIIIMVLRFEKSRFKLLRESSSLKITAQNIAQNITPDTKAVIVLSNNKILAQAKVTDIFNQYTADLILAGGLAGSAAADQQSYIFDKKGIMKKGSIIIFLSGDQLQVQWAYSMGWESISREMEITRAENRAVYELDGRNILQVYSEFLGEDIKKQPLSTVVKKFPLILNKNFQNARSALEIVENGIRFSGNFKKGDKVKIAYGSLNEILSNAVSLRKKLNFFPEIALLYSCNARSDYFNSLNSNLSRELQVIPCQNTGFCTYGEYGIINSQVEFLNMTSTVLYLSEKEKTEAEKIKFKTENPQVKTEHLFHLSKKVISELEMINKKMRKANRRVSGKKIAAAAENIFKILFDTKKYSGGIVIKETENLINVYLDPKLSQTAYNVFKSFWNLNLNKIKIKANVLGFKKAFLIPLTKEVEALIIILSNELDLYDIKKNNLFIEQIPNYLKKAVLYESSERNLARLSTLEQTSDFLYSTLDLELLYERILDIIVGTLGMSAAVILKEENYELKVVKSINVSKNSKLLYYLKDHYKKAAFSEKISIENNITVEEDIKTLIAVPIDLNDYQGILYGLQSKYRQLINENQKNFIRTLANQIKVSIRNALNHHRVKRLSVTDGLTNLYNHSYFHQELKKKDGEKCSVAIIDIDNFKEFNDLYGHQAGDKVLRNLSKLLKNEIRADDIAARYGGEEFIIYFNIVKKEILAKIIRRLMEKIRSLEVKFNKEKLKITVSIGIAVNKDGNYSSERLIKDADTALYLAKGAGKNMMKFYAGE